MEKQLKGFGLFRRSHESAVDSAEVKQNENRIFQEVCQLVRAFREKHPSVGYAVRLERSAPLEPGPAPSRYSAWLIVSLSRNQTILESGPDTTEWPDARDEITRVRGKKLTVSDAYARLIEEDPAIRFVVDPETKQQIISGLGTQHLEVALAKLKNKFGVEITLENPRVPYRESIRKSCKAQGRHKKQTGGHGQFGDVWIQFEPIEGEGIEFAENVFGGSVPKNFFPAVEKGVRQAAEHGVLAGYPMVGMKATLLDGSYHPVDSSEMAFIMAAKLAYKAAIPEAGPVLLEPIGALKAHVPADNTGDIMGEVTKRRGRVLGMNPDDDGLQVVEAEVPVAEMQDFTTFLRQLTQGRGYFTFEFVRYETLPQMLENKVIEQAKALGNFADED